MLFLVSKKLTYTFQIKHVTKRRKHGSHAQTANIAVLINYQLLKPANSNMMKPIDDKDLQQKALYITRLICMANDNGGLVGDGVKCRTSAITCSE